MMIVLCTVLFAAAFILRDGWPALGSTALARASAGLLLVIGCLLAGGLTWTAAIIGVAFAAGFWTDHEHATGQQARTWSDVGWLLISGVTSLVPVIVAIVVIDLPRHADIHMKWALSTVMVLAILKPVVWFLSREAMPDSTHTRLAAGVWGALAGCVVFALV